MTGDAMTNPDVASAVPEEVGRWREIRESVSRTMRTLGLGRAVRLSDLRTGHWFDRLTTLYLKHHDRQLLAPYTPGFDDELQARAEAVIARSAIQAALLGSGTAALSTGAIWLTSETGGYGGLLALPLAAAGIGGDMVGRALLHLQMTCEIADLYGVGFQPEDQGDLAQLYAIAFGVEEYDEEESDRGRRLIERIAVLRERETGAAIGSKLTSESLLRNLIPFVGIPISAYGSHRLTKRIGRAVHQYVRYRAVVDPLIEDFDTDSLDILIEGIWFALSAEGPVHPAGVAILAHLVDLRAHEVRDELTSRFLEDDSQWIDRLKAVRPEIRTRMQRALEAAATVESPVPESRIAMLRRAADTLNQELDEERIAPPKRVRPRRRPSETELH
jgi:hypothetical protein